MEFRKREVLDGLNVFALYAEKKKYTNGNCTCEEPVNTICNKTNTSRCSS